MVELEIRGWLLFKSIEALFDGLPARPAASSIRAKLAKFAILRENFGAAEWARLQTGRPLLLGDVNTLASALGSSELDEPLEYLEALTATRVGEGVREKWMALLSAEHYAYDEGEWPWGWLEGRAELHYVYGILRALGGRVRTPKARAPI